MTGTMTSAVNRIFNAHLTTFVEGYRAKGMTRVEGARIPDASHFVVADNPQAVAELIERYAAESTGRLRRDCRNASCRPHAVKQHRAVRRSWPHVLGNTPPANSGVSHAA